MYGVSGIPHAQWGGNQSVIGGGGSTYNQYVSKYNSISSESSPAEIELLLEINLQGQLAIQADIELTGNISTTNNKLVFILTYDFEPQQTPDYFCSAISYNDQVFSLTTAGQTGSYEQTVTMNPSWDLAKIKAIVLIQTFSGNHKIHQAAITEFSGLLPMFTSNVTEGPAHLVVQFTSNSFPQTGIESWEWDFDGDGTFDSTEENPCHLYTEPGSFDVTLRIGMGGEYEETTAVDYVTVTDGSNVSGSLSGIWVTDFSPYNVTNAVTIASENQLIIEPGVEVNFGSDVQLTVYGNLVADASARDGEPIILTSGTNWKGIRFTGTQEDNIINNCDISKANECAISIENDSYVDIIGNVIHDNSNISKGTIEVIGSNNVLISQNLISNNESSTSTAGISCNNSLAEISNNVIVNNTGQFSAFRLQNGSDIQLTNNTIANNESTNSGTSILIFCMGSSPVIQNCIIVDSDTTLFYPPGVFDITYTCIFEGFTGTGNIDEDPLFVNPTAGDGINYDGLSASWWLQENSPCIDAGNPDPIYNDPNGSRNDMGAYGGPNSIESTSIENNIVNIITQSSISVYPNPFNPSGAGRSPETNIALSLSEQDKQHPVYVGIYNVKGQLVKTLIDNKNVSNTRFIWNGKNNTGSNASTGVYLIKMETVSSITSRKILMLK